MAQKTTWVVTGGFGFVGSALCRALSKLPDVRLVVVDALTYAADLAAIPMWELDPRITFENIDIANRKEVERVIELYEPDLVVHLAAESHVDRSIKQPEAFVQTNVVGTFNLLEALRQYYKGLDETRQGRFRFVHVSTDEVFGELEGDDDYFDEDSAYMPSSPYASTKAAADHLVRAWGRTYGLPFIITHSTNNYGPFQHVEKLIPRMVTLAVSGRRLPVYGDGSHVRDWLHVEDHAQALIAIANFGVVGETYAIGARCERSNLEVVTSICDIIDESFPMSSKLPRSSLIEHVCDRPGHDRRYALSTEKLSRTLGWNPSIKFEDGLRQTIDWFLHRTRCWGKA